MAAHGNAVLTNPVPLPLGRSQLARIDRRPRAPILTRRIPYQERLQPPIWRPGFLVLTMPEIALRPPFPQTRITHHSAVAHDAPQKADLRPRRPLIYPSIWPVEV